MRDAGHATDASGEATPEFLAIGHIARDLLPDGGWRLGGTVTFAALTAQRLGLRAGIVTSAPDDLLAALAETLPGVAISALPSAQATTFENIYEGRTRRQFVRGCAAPLTPDAVPPAWRRARIVLLGPLVGEVAPELATSFPEALVAATPQGWLRQWDATGAVFPAPLGKAASALPFLRALILSQDDLPAFAAPAPEPSDGPEPHPLVTAWARHVPSIVVTRGAEGAVLYERGSTPRAFAGFPAREVDPTGAGDVFAAAFLCALAEQGDAHAAVAFANRVAACSVEAVGGAGIPTREELAQRF